MLKKYKILLAIFCCIFCLIFTIVLHISFTYIIYNNSLKSEMQDLNNKVNNICIVIDTTRNMLSHSKKENGDNYTEEEIKQEVTSILRKQFYTFSYETNSYFWINEVINYNGGDNYAIRLIHPNLKDTEGFYLSTYTQDAEGNFPYLDELNIMKSQGEGFYSYYFKNFNNNEITKKITYAKLYRDYNWIICIGTPYQTIVDNSTFSYTKFKYCITIGYVLSFISLSLLILYFFHLYKKEKLLLKNKNNSLQSQVDFDTLTMAYSRRYGIKLLKNLLDNKTNSIIVMFDLDKFKYVNDTFGHKCGDIVLIEITKTIIKNIRKEDKLIRWGGDEFIIIFFNLNESNINSIMEKLNKEVNELQFNFSKPYNPSISIGVSNFSDSDKSIEDVLHRADTALYKAKKKRNTFECHLVPNTFKN